MKSPQCQMEKNNLARVFGPTIIGHAMVDPTPLVILKDTNSQLKVRNAVLCWDGAGRGENFSPKFIMVSI